MRDFWTWGRRAVFGGGWWFWIDAVVCSSVKVSVLHYLPVCRKWRILGSDNSLWSKLFIDRWGLGQASFYAPSDSKSWKHVYFVQHRCERNRLGLKIIREGDDYYVIHQGEIQRHLGSRNSKIQDIWDSPGCKRGAEVVDDGEEEPSLGILDKILFFIGDMEAASTQAKRSRVV